MILIKIQHPSDDYFSHPDALAAKVVPLSAN
jgi:hypothetical protein